MKDESTQQAGKVATAANDEPHVKQGNSQVRSIITEKLVVFDQELSSAMKDSVANNLYTMVEDLMDEILCTLLSNAQNGIQLFLGKVVEKEILDLLQKETIGEMIDINKARFRERMQLPIGCRGGC